MKLQCPYEETQLLTGPYVKDPNRAVGLGPAPATISGSFRPADRQIDVEPHIRSIVKGL